PSLKITNEYLTTQQDLTTEFNLRFILEGAVDADSRVFDLLTKYKSNIVAITNVEVVNARVETACKNALKKAVEYKNEDLLKETKAKMKAANPERAESFGYESDMYFYKSVKDADNF
ncbi:MAG: hypothetical protein ACKOCH_13490, partial [Bacteroidota bacterium]